MNSVRKLEGGEGELAKKLVMQWKDMVADAEKAEKLKPPVPLFSKSAHTVRLIVPDVQFITRITYKT